MTKGDLLRLVDPKVQKFEEIPLTTLQGLLAFEKRVRWATLITHTAPNMNKRNNPHWGNLFKLSRTNFLIRPSTSAYADAVNNQRVREGGLADFVPQPRSWGTRMQGIPFVAHLNKLGETKFYLEVYARKNFREIFLDGAGNIVDKEIVKPYLIKSRHPMTQQTKKPVILRDYSVENLVAVAVDRKRYLIRD